MDKKPKLNIKINAHMISIAVNALIMLTIVIFQEKIPPEIPLYYGLPSEEQLAQKNHLILPAAIALGISVVNAAISTQTRNEFIKNILTAGSIIATILATVAIAKIALLVGNFV
jgi:hypothetical protein